MRRRNAVLVGNELECCHPASRLECCINLPEQLLIGGNVEVMEKRSEKNHVISASEIDIEGAAGDGAVAVRNSGFGGILFGDFQHVGPIDAYDAGFGIALGNRDSE